MLDSATGFYAWGLDGSPATVITDWVFGGLCSVYGCCILHLYWTSESSITVKKAEKHPDLNNVDNPKRVDDNEETKSRPLLLVLSLTFFICAAMNAIGALIHHFVPLVEPVLKPLEDASSSEKGLTFTGRMRLKLYPWYLAWQVANVFAALYGFFTFLSAIYSMEFDVFLREAGLLAGTECKKGKTTKTATLQRTKKILQVVVFFMFLSHFAFRFWRIIEYRIGIFEEKYVEDDAGMDVNLAKLDIDRFGNIWSATAASAIMFSSFAINSIISTYMMIIHIWTKGKQNYRSFGGSKVGLMRVLGAWILTGGGFVQLFYANSCGSNTPTDCPFPATFNHNAWYHVLQGAGMTLWFLAEWTYFNQRTSNVTKKEQ